MSDIETTVQLEPMLYLCATPIGNPSDITLRTIDTLKGVSAVYCEDTRRTRELMTHLGIKKPLIACHEHNERQRAEEIAERVLSGCPQGTPASWAFCRGTVSPGARPWQKSARTKAR